MPHHWNPAPGSDDLECQDCPLPKGHPQHDVPPPPLRQTAAEGDRGGVTFDQASDGDRLNSQALAVFDVMCDGEWRTLAQVSAVTGAPEASVSARLRDYRKPEFGALVVDRRRNGPVWEYRLLIPEGAVT